MVGVFAEPSPRYPCVAVPDVEGERIASSPRRFFVGFPTDPARRRIVAAKEPL